MDGCSASSGGEVLVVVVVVVVIGYWWWRSGGGGGGDSLCKGGSCNSCRSAIVKVAVVDVFHCNNHIRFSKK